MFTSSYGSFERVTIGSSGTVHPPRRLCEPLLIVAGSESAMSNVIHRERFKRDHRWAPGRMSAYLDGELGSRSRARLERHTGECPECRGVLNSLRRMLGRLHRLAPADSRSDTPDIAAAVRARLDEPDGR
jgi:hypothetical protein